MNNEPETNYNLIALIGIISIGICIILFGKLKKSYIDFWDWNKNYRYKTLPSSKLTVVHIRVRGGQLIPGSDTDLLAPFWRKDRYPSDFRRFLFVFLCNRDAATPFLLGEINGSYDFTTAEILARIVRSENLELNIFGVLKIVPHTLKLIVSEMQVMEMNYRHL